MLTSFGMSLEEEAEQIFEGITMLIAAGILTWMIFWMGKQARFLKSELEDGVNKAASTTGKRAVFTLAFMAVVREGVELAIFVTAAFFASNQGETSTNLIQILAGTILGLGTAVLLGYTIFATTVRLDLRRFFQVTGVLLLLFAAGLVGHGVHEFNEVGWIPNVIEHVYDLNPVLDENSTAGVMLKALLGYNGNPSLTETLSYVAYLGAVILALRWTGRKEATAPAQVAA